MGKPRLVQTGRTSRPAPLGTPRREHLDEPLVDGWLARLDQLGAERSRRWHRTSLEAIAGVAAPCLSRPSLAQDCPLGILPITNGTE